MKFVPLTLLIAVTIFSACHKESTDPDPVPGQVVKHLVKAYSSASNYAHIDSFAFDNQGRCVRILEKSYYLPGNPPDAFDFFYDFHYNGTDTLPYKITDTSRGKDMVWLIQYDAQQRKIVDSIIYSNPAKTSVTRYIYKSNQIIANTYQNLGANPPVFYRTDTFDYNGINCSRYSQTYDLVGVRTYFQYVITYDNAINPYSTLNIARSVVFGTTGLGAVGDGIPGINKNNPVSMVYSSDDPSVGGVTTFQYVRDADGYPISSTMSNNGAGGGEKFEYKK
jgi:hypothetical protein